MADETNSLVQIKGLRDGLLVSLDDASWEEQRTALITQVDAQPSFFQGARLALDVSSQILHVNELVDLRDQLSERVSDHGENRPTAWACHSNLQAAA